MSLDRYRLPITDTGCGDDLGGVHAVASHIQVDVG
jgi:hypothetical protein